MNKSPELYKIPPQSLEAEEALLASCLIVKEVIDIVEILKPSHFYKSAHQKIFSAICNIVTIGKPADIVLLMNELRSRDQLEEIGGAAYLAKLTEAPLAANISQYAQIIKEKAALRETIMKCSEITNKCFQDTEGAPTVIEDAQKSILNISIDDPDEKTYSKISEIAEDVIEELDDRYRSKGRLTGLSTGFTQFDLLTHGLQPSDLIIIAGRPSMGKTSYCLDIALNNIIDNEPVIIFSMEMSKKQLLYRVLSSDTKIHSTKFKTGQFLKEEWFKLTNSISRLTTFPLYIDDSSALHYNQIRRRARYITKAHGIKLIIIDYAQLMRGDKGSTEDREMTSISGAMKALAKDLNIPVILISQLNRKCEERTNKRPLMADIRGSGSLEQDADLIAFLYRHEQYLQHLEPDEKEKKMLEWKGRAELHLAKHRNGPTGMIYLYFKEDHATFYSMEPDY